MLPHSNIFLCVFHIETNVTICAPHEVRMNDICCLGLSTQGTLPINNITNRWLDVRLSICSVTINGQAQDPDKSHPFITKEKAIIDPGNTEEVKVRCIIIVTFQQLQLLLAAYS